MNNSLSNAVISRRNFLISSGIMATGVLAIQKELASAQAKDSLTVPVISNPGTLNPILMASTAELQVATPLHQSLVQIDPENFEPGPLLAESWEVSEDGLAWTFNLRTDVTWHDGEPFTAEDVKFTMDTMVDAEVNSTRGRQFITITETEVVDDHTVRFHLESPWASLPVIIAGRWSAAPKHILEGVDIATDTSYTANPIGVGPYKYVDASSGDYVQLEAYEGYFGGTPAINRVVFRIVPDSNVQIAQLRTGELDAIPFFPDASIQSVEGIPGVVVDRAPESIWYALHVNNNREELFGDKRVRQALSFAIDKEALIQGVLHGEGRVATGPIIPEIEWAYNPDVMLFPYDPDRARDLLAEAGWTDTGDGWEKDGITLEFTLTAFTGNATVEQTAVLVQQYLADIGVKANMEVLEFSTFITDVRDNRAPDGYYSFISYMTPEPEPDGNFAYFHSSNAERGSNFTAYSNPEVDELLELGRTSTDDEERREAYFKVQEILAEDQTRIFLFYPSANLARNEDLQGLPPNKTLHHLVRASWAE